jgi:hypothetical protein
MKESGERRRMKESGERRANWQSCGSSPGDSIAFKRIQGQNIRIIRENWRDRTLG